MRPCTLHLPLKFQGNVTGGSPLVKPISRQNPVREVSPPPQVESR
jgi:hypothetical protein